MKPKFTLITHDYPPAHGGIARYLSSLVQAAKGQIDVLIPKDHMYLVPRTSYNNLRELNLENSPTIKTSDGYSDVQSTMYDVRNVRFWWSLWPKWLPLIKRCLEAPAENIILVSHVFPIGTAAWIANILGGNDYAVIFHGTDLKRAQTRWKRWLLRRICKKALILIVNSEATQKLIKRLVPSADTTKLTPGLDPFELPSKPESREQLNITPDTKVILSVSRLVERKGIDTLIQAVAELSAKYEIQNTKFELVIIGDGGYSESLHKLADLSDINVRWITGANDETLHDWYAAADIFCLPGRETPDDIEGFGMVFLEAAFAGLPVIAGESGGASEAVQNNKTGLLIPPTVEACTEALVKLLDDPNLATKLGTAGRNRVIKDFNWADRWQTLSSNVRRQISNTTKQPETLDVKHSTLDVSIVIPCYNHAEELKTTLESLAKQTVGIKEVIIVDDASVDDVALAIESCKDKLPIKLIRHEQNKGAPTARNTGFRSAAGEFIIFLDADIILEPEALEKMHKTLVANPNASYAFSDFYWGKIHFKGQPFSVASLQKLNYIHTSSLIRRQDMVEFDESLKKFQDWDLWLTMGEQGRTGVWIPETLFKVVERKTGMSRWLPSFAHKIPWPILGYTPHEIKRYREAEQIIKTKHNLK